MIDTVYLDIRNTDPTEAHLFEHVFLMNFYQYLEQNNINPYLIGWLTADCFDDFLFVDYGFYQPKIEQLFQKYLNKPTPINLSLIKSELAVIEAEIGQTIEIIEESKLLKNLTDLQTRAWNKICQPVTQNPQLKLKPGSLKIVNFSLKLSLTTTDLTLQSLFLRAFVFFTDIAQLALRRQFSAYPTHNSSATIGPDQLNTVYCTVDFAIHAKDYNQQKIEQFVNTTLSSFDFAREQPAIKAHLSFFQNEPLLRHLKIDRYRYSGINIDNQTIARFYTIERLRQIQKQLQVVITENIE